MIREPFETRCHVAVNPVSPVVTGCDNFTRSVRRHVVVLLRQEVVHREFRRVRNVDSHTELRNGDTSRQGGLYTQRQHVRDGAGRHRHRHQHTGERTVVFIQFKKYVACITSAASWSMTASILKTPSHCV